MSRSQYYKQFFLDADADNSGSITLKEMIGIMRSKGYKGNDDEIKKMFRRADDSGDGSISLEEFMIVMGEQPEKDHKQAAIRGVFRSFDKDNSGTIDRNELQMVFAEIGKSMSEDDVNRIMELADKDDSQTLNYEEFVSEVFG